MNKIDVIATAFGLNEETKNYIKGLMDGFERKQSIDNYIAAQQLYLKGFYKLEEVEESRKKAEEAMEFYNIDVNFLKIEDKEKVLTNG